jgi:hypothetical protein
MLSAMAKGLAGGAAGVATMTLAEKVEQRLTHRPSSFVPGHTLARVLRRPDRRDERRRALNLAMHWGQGIALGSLRGVMSEAGLRGPWASAMFAVVRLTNDQTLENATGVGAPPWTWPRDELAIDLAHKTIYAFATGAVTDALTDARAQRRRPPPGARRRARRAAPRRWRRRPG